MVGSDGKGVVASIPVPQMITLRLSTNWSAVLRSPYLSINRGIPSGVLMSVIGSQSILSAIDTIVKLSFRLFDCARDFLCNETR